MTGTMKALVKASPAPGMEMRERPIPEPGAGEVRIRVRAVGIDGGFEAPIYRWEEDKHYLAGQLPHVFGHEFAGVVDAVGEGVESVSEGDRVAAEPGITCGECRNCREGRMDVCPNREVVGIDLDPGGLAEFTVLPARNCYPIGPDLSFDEASYFEVLGIGVNALEYSDVRAGDSVAITGPGPVGFGVLVACVAAGADSIAMVGAEVDAGTRLPTAERVGADETHVIGDADFPEVDVAFEASGHPSALGCAISSVRDGGQVVQIGLYHGHDRVPTDLNALVTKGVDLQGIRSRRESSWRRAVSVARQVDLSPIIGPTFGMDEFEAAFEAERQREGVKVVLNP